MSTPFATLAAMDGRDLWWGLEMSVDNFATVAYRWATHSGVVDGGLFEARILDPIPDFTRGLGVDHLPASSDLSFQLANWDFVVDFLADYATFATNGFQARFRVKVGLTDPAGTDTTQASVVTKTVGYFVHADYPSREEGVITITLTDDQLGQLNDLLTPPTCNDWIANNDDTDCPMVGSSALPQMDFNIPWPLRFGLNVDGWTAIPIPGRYDDALSATFQGTADPGNGALMGIYPAAICATRDHTAPITGGVNGTVQTVTMVFKNSDQLVSGQEWGGKAVGLPELWSAYGSGLQRNWQLYKSEAINKDGVDWYLLWIGFDLDVVYNWFRIAPAGLGDPVQTGANGQAPIPWPLIGDGTPGDKGCNFWGAIDHFVCFGKGPWSEMTNLAQTGQVPTDVIKDLIAYYSPMKDTPPVTGPINAAKFGRAKAARGSFQVTGEVQVPYASASKGAPVQPFDRFGKLAYQGGLLRQALSNLCASSDIDLFIDFNGQAAVVAQIADYASQTATYPELDETRIDNVRERVPSAGERWEPYNVVFVSQSDGNRYGPFRNEDALTAWGRELPRDLNGTWWPYLKQIQAQGLSSLGTESAVWTSRALEAKVRPVVTFDTDLSFFALGVDLGDDFLFSWTRGGNSTVYSRVLFRCEQMVFHPSRGSVTVTAVWMDDLRTAKPYLLDDETLVTRVSSSVGRTATVADGSTTVTFSSGSLITDGVQAGDILVLQDPTDAATAFYRNRMLRVASITDATHLVVTNPDLNFNAPTGAAVATWKIQRGFRTYPTSASDPTHYPDGSTMYGKVSNTAGEYSDASDANELLDG